MNITRQNLSIFSTIISVVVVIFYIVLLTSTTAVGVEAATAIKILFIGNSYTQGLPPSSIINLINSAPGNAFSASYSGVLAGGQKLWQTTYEAIASGSTGSGIEAIKSYAPTHLVLQDQSQYPVLNSYWFYRAFRNLSRTAFDLHSTTTVAFATWGRGPLSPYYSPSSDWYQNEPTANTYELYTTTLLERYSNASRFYPYYPNNSSRLAPCGVAFYNWMQKSGNPTVYGGDHSHENSLGGYLCAAVIASAITGVDARCLSYVASGIDANTATELRAEAADAIQWYQYEYSPSLMGTNQWFPQYVPANQSCVSTTTTTTTSLPTTTTSVPTTSSVTSSTTIPSSSSTTTPTPTTTTNPATSTTTITPTSAPTTTTTAEPTSSSTTLATSSASSSTDTSTTVSSSDSTTITSSPAPPTTTTSSSSASTTSTTPSSSPTSTTTAATTTSATSSNTDIQTSSTTSTTMSPNNTTLSPNSSSSATVGDRSSGLSAPAAVSISAFFVVIIALIVLFFWYKRKKNNEEQGNNNNNNEDGSSGCEQKARRLLSLPTTSHPSEPSESKKVNPFAPVEMTSSTSV